MHYPGAPWVQTKDALSHPIIKGVRQDEPTFSAALKLDEGTKSKDATPMKVLEVLKSFKDVMPQELLKQLSPKQKVDYKIELVPDTQPSAHTPYRMSLSKLEDCKDNLRS